MTPTNLTYYDSNLCFAVATAKAKRSAANTK